MWRFGLAQTRAGWRRLLAAGIAVALGAAFVSATAILAGLFREAAADAAGRSFAMAGATYDADYVVYANSVTITTDMANELTHADDTFIVAYAAAALASPDSISVAQITSEPTSAFGPESVIEGSHPSASTDIVLSATLATRLGVSVGDSVELHAVDYTELGTSSVPTGLLLTVSGVSADLEGDVIGSLGAAWMSETGIDAVSAVFPPDSVWAQSLLVNTSDPAALEAELNELPWVAGYESRDQLAESAFMAYTGLANPITTVSVLFVVVALSVAGMVVANTLEVLAVQRATVIGVLRSMGATRRQIQSAVMQEAFLVGLAGGIVGAALGQLLVIALLGVLGRTGLPAEWRVQYEFVPWTFALPILVGVLVAVVTAVIPARFASAVPPLAAVRRVTSPRSRPGATVRVLGVVLIALGLLTSAVSLSVRSSIGGFTEMDTTPILALALVGALVSGVGLLLISPIVFPAISWLLGSALRRLVPRGMRAPVTLARTNLLANARRTSATSNALLVGVTLMALLATGASTARASLSAVAEGFLPTDITVTAIDSIRTRIPESFVDEVAQIDGVEAVAPLYSAWARISTANSYSEMEILAAVPEEIAAASYSSEIAASLRPGVIAINPQNGYADGSTVRISLQQQLPFAATGAFGDSVPTDAAATESSSPPSSITLEASTRAMPLWQGLITPEDATALGMDLSPGPSQIWVKAEPGRWEEVARAIVVALPSDGSFGLEPFFIDTPAVGRTDSETTIDAVVAVGAGLLAISILIAIVGVTNTLSLSVFERRQEIALLRSVGLTRRQLRVSLAAEGLIITIAAAVLGILLGGIIGAATSSMLFSGSAGTQFVIPWGSFGLILVVSLIAGPLASVLPARQAIGSSPVESLSER